MLDLQRLAQLIELMLATGLTRATGKLTLPPSSGVHSPSPENAGTGA